MGRSSFISPEQAELNLRELDGKSLDRLAGEGRDRWNEVLAASEDDDTDNLRTFYSCSTVRCSSRDSFGD